MATCTTSACATSCSRTRNPRPPQATEPLLRSDWKFARTRAVTGNHIHDIGTIDKQAAGVQIETVARIRVDHKSIYDGPRAGIDVGDGNRGGHRITHNDVFDTVLESGDHGAFNSRGARPLLH
ncbi:hypothetical protein HAV22_22910 [Massilia sp. TW-1]|uniref:Right handed beta helix domain-containing protein n=2 Tax=Telluria antibiotica TaxID=2717319 RepID=A0ABX0PGB3_9BURK|nr:hypothetical protein [Telluria antibiotica]